MKHPAFASELLDIHGNYEKNKPFFGAIGGQLQQLYFVVECIINAFQDDLGDYYSRLQADPTDDSLKTPQNLMELTVDHFFLGAMLQYFKDMR